MLRCGVLLAGESANRLDHYEVVREQSTIRVKVFSSLRGYRGVLGTFFEKQDGFHQIVIELEPGDQSVVLTDDREERVIWLRSAEEPEDYQTEHN